MQARIEDDRFRPGMKTLVVDGTPQSQVDLQDPTELGFEYIQRIANVIDLIGEPTEAITAVHLGAGALTLPRYVAARRPGSRQQVLELERELVDFVREHLPLPRDSNIRVRYGDARETLAKLPDALLGVVDLLVIDIFSGARIPAHVTTVEFYTEAVRLLAPSGIVAINLADGPGLRFARGQASTLSAVLPEVAALAETQILKGRRFGNLVLIGSKAPLPLGWLPRLLAAGPHPAKAVAGRELREFIAGAPVVTDATAVPSPPPGRSIFQIGRD
ncbi:spermidine synthase [Naasia lichenicola]|uniref:Spermine synthase n=1 Tax=Naasia lichenicola TaxID=2565933 RepID=A0A4S4FIQ3_9MICO|nr:spermine synthase [Naasia lichenicola]